MLIHGVDFPAQEVAQLPPVHSGKPAGDGNGLIQRRHSLGQPAEGEDHQLQGPLQIGARLVAGEAPFVQPDFQGFGGEAIAKYEVLYHLLRIPLEVQAVGV